MKDIGGFDSGNCVRCGSFNTAPFHDPRVTVNRQCLACGAYWIAQAPKDPDPLIKRVQELEATMVALQEGLEWCAARSLRSSNPQINQKGEMEIALLAVASQVRALLASPNPGERAKAVLDAAVQRYSDLNSRPRTEWSPGDRLIWNAVRAWKGAGDAKD